MNDSERNYIRLGSDYMDRLGFKGGIILLFHASQFWPV